MKAVLLHFHVELSTTQCVLSQCHVSLWQHRVLTSVELAKLTLRRGDNIKIVFRAHTYSAYHGAQLSWNAFNDTKHYPLGSHGQAGESTTIANSPKKAYTRRDTEPNIRTLTLPYCIIYWFSNWGIISNCLRKLHVMPPWVKNRIKLPAMMDSAWLIIEIVLNWKHDVWHAF